jgi:hypothetical protein
MDISGIVAELEKGLVSPEAARRRPAAGGIPNEPGVYAWFCDEDGLLQLPFDGARAGRGAIYVGIAPSRLGSKQMLRSRVCGNHLRGNISASTFRLSLAAVLWQQEKWALTRRGNRALLARDANDALSDWLHCHLRISWIVRREPWQMEAQVIKAMSPVLNLAQNRQHPYGWTLREARQRLRSAALSSTVSR